MKAGKTDFEVGTMVVITDSDDEDMVGIVGRITHPFPGLIAEEYDKYVAGVYLDKPGIFQKNICNLTVNDKIHNEK